MTERPIILVVNGPNLNTLGRRQPEIYGAETLDDVERIARDRAAALGYALESFQSNFEGTLVERVQRAREDAVGIVVNPAGLTTTSVPLLDALLYTELPFVEVHLSNIHRRDAFRTPSLISTGAAAVIAGAGALGYALAVEALAAILGTRATA